MNLHVAYYLEAFYWAVHSNVKYIYASLAPRPPTNQRRQIQTELPLAYEEPALVIVRTFESLYYYNKLARQ